MSDNHADTEPVSTPLETPTERRPLESKTTRAYLGLGTMVTLMVGGVLVATGHHSKPHAAEQPNADTQVVTPDSTSMDQFNKNVAKEVARQEAIRASQPTPQTTVGKAKPSMVDSALNGDTNKDAEAEHKARLAFKLAEIKRGLAAAHASWGGITPAKSTHGATTVPVSSSIQGKTVQDRLADVAKRIEEVNRLRQRLSAGDMSAITPNLKHKLTSLESTFRPPPSGIVGYTTSNKYDADIKGKMKLPVGTVIPAITAMKTVSDYAGPMKGIITQDVYDPTYQYVLIPKGSEVVMKSVRISNVNEPISARMGLTVQWVVLPNGNRIDFSKSAGLDREGVAGLKDQVNYHFMAQFLGVAAYALVSNDTSYEGSGANQNQTYAGNLGENVRKQFSPLAQKYLNLVPTITLKAGQSMNIIVEDDIYLKPWKNIYKDYQS